MNTTQQTDTLVIGGGLGGLAAAVYLARAGVQVTLLEKGADLGGRAATDDFNGFAFNRGIHALYCGGATEKALKDLHIPYTGQTPSGIRVLADGKLHTAPVGMMSMLSTRLLSAADKLDLMRIFATLPQIDAYSLRHTSVQTWIDQQTQRPRVRQLLIANACTFVYSSALDLVSAEVFIQKTQLAFKHPVTYIDGGWQTLVKGLRQVAEAAGVRIIMGTRAESLITNDNTVTGVTLADGQMIRAQNVIIATTPQEAVKLMPDTLVPLKQSLHALVPAQLACLDVALKRLPNPDAPVVQDLEQPLFMSTQSLFSKVAPEGSALIYSFKQLDPMQSSDPRADEAELEAFLDAVQPGWREVIVKRRMLPRIQAIGALPTAQMGGFAGRPSPIVEGMAGLYLVGDWVGSEGFLADASFASARDVTQHIRQAVTDPIMA